MSILDPFEVMDEIAKWYWLEEVSGQWDVGHWPEADEDEFDQVDWPGDENQASGIFKFTYKPWEKGEDYGKSVSYEVTVRKIGESG